MKGVTQCLRDLERGEIVDIVGTSRSDLHKIAKRLDIKITVTKTVWGFHVARVDDKPQVAAQTQQEKLAMLRALISGDKPAEQPKPDPPDEGWIELTPSYQNGQILYWRKRPKGVPENYRTESNLESC